MSRESSNKPPEVNETGIRLKSGLKKALIFGAIGLAAAVGIGLFMVGPQAAIGGGIVDYLFGTSILKTGGMIGLGIPLAAAGAGFLMGATDEKPILQAKAEARREWNQERREDVQEATAARAQHIESEKQKEMLGMGHPGGLPAFSPGMGGTGGKGRGGGLFGG